MAKILDLDLMQVEPFEISGRVNEITGNKIIATIDCASIGDLVQIERTSGAAPLICRITGFSQEGVTLTPYGEVTKINLGAKVTMLPTISPVQDINLCLGNVLNHFGLEDDHNNWAPRFSSYNSTPPDLKDSVAPSKRLSSGVNLIDLFTPLAYGQRIGIYAEAGVGKSSLLHAINTFADADVFIFALIGERRREVVEFTQQLKSSGQIGKSIIVQATSDQSAISRIQAAETAIAIAEQFRDNGKNVLLALDSATRLFRAFREVGLASGEMPVRKGYPPSAFAALPKIVERIGVTSKGSITGLFTVLLSDDLEQDPMVEELKSLTDGHIYLSKKIAEKGLYPAIDILRSLSRLEKKIQLDEIYILAKNLRSLLSEEENESELLLLSGDRNSLQNARRLLLDKMTATLSTSRDEMSYDDVVNIVKGELLTYRSYAANRSSFSRETTADRG